MALEWESWRIPFTVEVDLKATLLADIQTQMSGAIGFDPPSLIAAANWCLHQDINMDQALGWINSATNPNLGGINSFQALSVKSGILRKKGKNEESDLIMKQAVDNANTMELHQYGRQLLAEKVSEALAVLKKSSEKQRSLAYQCRYDASLFSFGQY
ncbi:MAG: hypothetical protein IPP49_01555 [Saprospiraceae bacterium]|nr:hypothetical protein [Saprospiraceae bacterium]